MLKTDITHPLNPDYIRIDERNLRDRLRFASDYAQLIYFYDLNNRKNGNWSSFFLKDPVIFLASISKIHYKHTYDTFGSLLTYSERLFSEQITPAIFTTLKEVLIKLFDQVQTLFYEVNEWVLNVDKNDKSYDLKVFILHKVKSGDVGLTYWKFFALKQFFVTNFSNISFSKKKPVDRLSEAWYTQKTSFNIYNEFNISETPSENEGSVSTLKLIQEHLHTCFQILFKFYTQVIEHAKHSFNKLSKEFNKRLVIAPAT